ncbi:anthranilate phosphoribosyltransferase [Cytobacillus sp. Hz8]|uniref:anthranilate phosphoribosyltransferase n=1 Tax=Cytobacillus sp. Hz8 TaxID=3347168 RepID=UPI0035DD72C1
MKAYLERISEGSGLTELEMRGAIEKIFNDEVSDSEIAALMIGLKMKGETVSEIAGIANALRSKSLLFSKKIPNVMDNCGTGGDRSQSFNVSSTSAFVIAGAGIPVAKHGNRSITSKTGSADVLEYLGISLQLPQEAIEELIEEVGIAFLFAPHVHPNLKRIMKVRMDLRIPTTFNLIGPLTNPVDLDSQLLGIYRSDLIDMFAEVLKSLGRKRALVITGAGNMDEASLQGENQMALLENGEITKIFLHPEEVGLPVVNNEQIRGGDAKENADILLRVLKGEKGPYRDTVLLNAGLAIYTAGKVNSIQEGVQLAADIIDSGTAFQKLEQLIEKSQRFSLGVN